MSVVLTGFSKSEALRYRLRAQARTVARRPVNLVWGNAVAYDPVQDVIILDINHPSLEKAQEDVQKLVLTKAWATHEGGHVLYTDRTAWMNLIKWATALDPQRPALGHLLKILMNALEDARIELAVANDREGCRKLLQYSNEFYFEHHEGLDKVQGRMNLFVEGFLQKAVVGRYKGEIPDQEVKNLLKQCEPRIHAARYAPTTKAVTVEVQKIWNIIRDFVEREIPQMTQPPSLGSVGKPEDEGSGQDHNRTKAPKPQREVHKQLPRPGGTQEDDSKAPQKTGKKGSKAKKDGKKPDQAGESGDTGDDSGDAGNDGDKEEESEGEGQGGDSGKPEDSQEEGDESSSGGGAEGEDGDREEDEPKPKKPKGKGKGKSKDREAGDDDASRGGGGSEGDDSEEESGEDGDDDEEDPEDGDGQGDSDAGDEDGEDEGEEPESKPKPKRKKPKDDADDDSGDGEDEDDGDGEEDEDDESDDSGDADGSSEDSGADDDDFDYSEDQDPDEGDGDSEDDEPNEDDDPYEGEGPQDRHDGDPDEDDQSTSGNRAPKLPQPPMEEGDYEGEETVRDTAKDAEEDPDFKELLKKNAEELHDIQQDAKKEEEEKQQASQTALTAVPNQVKWESLHQGIQCETLTPVPDAEIYKNAEAVVLAQVETLVQFFNDVFARKPHRRGGKEWGRLDSKRLWRTEVDQRDTKVFWQNEPGNKLDVSICMMIDVSGSMVLDDRFGKACQAAVLLHLVCSRLGIPHAIVTFEAASGYARVYHKPLVTFENWRFAATRYNLADIIPLDNARDGYSVRVMTHYLRTTAKTKHKVLLVVSDGQPNHQVSPQYAPGCESCIGDVGIEDVRRAVSEAEQNGVSVIGISIGSNHGYMELIYPKRVCIEEVSMLSRYLAELLRRIALQ